MSLKTLDELLEALKLIDRALANVEHEVELLKAKFRSKSLQPTDLESKTNHAENSIKDDGFNEIRSLRKSGVIN